MGNGFTLIINLYPEKNLFRIYELLHCLSENLKNKQYKKGSGFSMIHIKKGQIVLSRNFSLKTILPFMITKAGQLTNI